MLRNQKLMEAIVGIYYLRCRQMFSQKYQNGSIITLSLTVFWFLKVFGPEAKQKTVFEHSVRGLVRDVLDGGNCLVFTYGVTNAGKTFTFLGQNPLKRSLNSSQTKVHREKQ